MAAMKIYHVGGAVRDQLLGLEVQDTDWVVVGATPEQMIALGYIPVGKDFPVFLHPKTHEEYALARTERKTGAGYTGFDCFASPEVTLEEDLKRRDLTINAMALSTTGQLIDPYHGQHDLQERVLRHVSDAFTEDPLRVLRVARFAARFADMDFHIADETLALMKQIAASGELQTLTAERVWQELARALASDTPAVFFNTLRSVDALQPLMPSIAEAFDQASPCSSFGSLGDYCLACLNTAAAISHHLEVRYAAFCHALDLNRTETHHLDALRQQLKTPNQPHELAVLAARYMTTFVQADELEPDQVLDLLETTDAFRRPERFQDLLTLGKATARLTAPDREYTLDKWLYQILKTCRSIDVQPWQQQGIEGPALGQAIRDRRIQLIAELKATSHG